MDDVVKMLDEKLRYLSHEIVEDTLFIQIASERLSVICPFCNAASTKVHSRYERTFYDLPIQGKRVIYVINNRKMFCHHAECHCKTFAKQFSFLPYTAKKSTRLEQEIMKITKNVSSLVAEKILNRGIAKVGKSIIRSLLKKQLKLIKPM
ncbi:transposase family protein [Bacillus toyonensis]|uniref:transposase family protein n=1 Tax=Bacillus toyonensis TaxID=155322 RepID=UPI0034664B11